MEQPPVWKWTLEELDRQITNGDTVTGAVAVAAISATLAISLLRMVLEMTAHKEGLESYRGQLQDLLGAAALESERLKQAADQDRAAYTAYRDSTLLPRATEQERAERRSAMQATLQQATETPLQAARCAVRAIELCAEAAPLARGDVAADIAGAAAILHGAVCAMLTSVDVNLRRIEGSEFLAERQDLEARATSYAEQVRNRLQKSGAEAR